MRTLILAAILAPAFSQHAIAHDWEVRRAHVADQNEEWSAAGYLPSWDVTFDDTADGFRIDGDTHGKFRGTVLVGRAVDVPSPLPASLKVRLRFKTFCELDHPARSGMPAVALFTTEKWNTLDSTTSPQLKFDARSLEHGPFYYSRFGLTGEDIVEWRDWQSSELRPVLQSYAGKRIILAVVWSAFHFNDEEWAALEEIEFALRNEEELLGEFYESLDLGIPALAEVRDAVSKFDWSAASAALARYYRTRQTPPPPPLSSRGSAAAADRICEHEFQFVGCPPYRLGPHIQWNEDPFDYDQWAIALNRHSHWLTLGAAYRATQNEKYAREFAAQLNSWIDAMPVHIGSRWVQGPYSEPGKAPLSLDAGIRMGQTWFPAFYAFLPSQSFTDGDVVAMLRSFRDHAIYLMDPRHFKEGSNWGAMEANGLLHIGCMLPEFQGAKKWRDTAIERLHGELDNQVYPDGAQMELSPGYHGVTLRNMLGAVEVAQRCEVSLPDDFLLKLERMFDYYIRIADPSRRTPPLNDSGAGSILYWLERGLQLFPQRSDFKYLLTDGKEGVPPVYTSTRLPYAGWHVMRSEWGKDACYVLFDGGPFGTGHQHEDKLSIIVHGFGRCLMTDVGNYSYDRSDWRRYVLSTRAHNTVLVDGLDQRHGACRESWQSTAPVDTAWVTEDSFDFAAASYVLGYGRSQNVPVEHHRSILFIKPRMWLVVDELKPKDDQSHSYESLFHLDASDAHLDEANRTVVTQHPSGANVAVVTVRADDWQVDVVQGQTTPTVQGWLPTGKHNDLRPIPTAVYRRTAQGDVLAAYLIAPLRHGEAAPTIECLPIDDGDAVGSFAFRVTAPDGTQHVVVWNSEPGTQIGASEVRTSGRVALFSNANALLGEVP